MSDNTTIIDRLYSINEGLAAKAPCVAVATTNITLSDTQTIDGIALAAGDRVLVTAQNSDADNGIYEVVANGSWTRSRDCDGERDLVKGTRVFVHSGTTNGQTEWLCTSTDPIKVGTDDLTFVEYCCCT